MIIVEGIRVEAEVVQTLFACNVSVCRGACCTIPGGRGAPVREDEVSHIIRASTLLGPGLSERHRKVLKDRGPLEGAAGDRFTVCVDNGACVFVVEQAGVAVCAIERAYVEGRFPWRKPLSCHLFPIRVDHHSQERLRFESFDPCAPAIERGEAENTSLIDFTHDALVRAYGQPWVDSLSHAASSRQSLR